MQSFYDESVDAIQSRTFLITYPWFLLANTFCSWRVSRKVRVEFVFNFPLLSCALLSMMWLQYVCHIMCMNMVNSSTLVALQFLENMYFERK